MSSKVAKSGSKTSSDSNSVTNSKTNSKDSSLTTMAVKEGLVLGFGNPLLDVTANVKPEFLKKYGLMPNDQILAEEKHMNMISELIKDFKVQFSAGGDMQNVLRVMQWFFKGKPNIAVFMGCVGTDDNANKLKAKAHEDGLNTLFMVDKTDRTGVCACLITNDGKNRSLCAYLGASQKFNIKHIVDNQKYVDNAKYIVTSGYELAVSHESVLNLAKHCEKNSQKVFIFALAAPYVCTKYPKQLLEIYPYIDYMFANEVESREFCELMKWEAFELKEITKLMAQTNCKPSGRKVIVTQGTENVLVADLTKVDTVQEFPVIKVAESKIVDTNGCGDAFVGGFLAQLIQGQPIDVCIKGANYAASQVVQNIGCNFPAINAFKS